MWFISLKLEGWPQSEMAEVESLHILHQFSAVETLQVSKGPARCIALALEGTTGQTVTEVLPSLNLICLAGQSASSIGRFIAARELSNPPVTVDDSTTAVK